MGKPDMAPKILVVEDEPSIHELISINLEMAGYRVIGAESAERATSLIRDELPDLALLDWMLPGESGIDLARKLRSEPRTRELPIIMLTARGEEEDKLRGLETGADDYITKPFSVRELEARIKAVLRRRAPEMTADPIEYHGLRLDPASHRVLGRRANRAGRHGIEHSGHGDDNGGPSMSLQMGPTEFRLLHFFMTHLERVYTRTQLLDFVWGDHVFIEERTVDVHIRRLRSALEPSGHDVLVQTVRGCGYRFAKD
jgi:two-component system, OmpR family, phosphate regulon response regulator PhoB